MSRNGSGTYSLVAGNPVVTGTTVSSTWANNTLSDIATALTQSIAVDGQSPITANIPLNSHKITGLAAGSTANDAIAYGQSSWSLAAGSITGAVTDSATFTMSGAPFNVVQGADVASASTINLDSATGNYVDVTGTTTITAITLTSGLRVTRFTGILTLTNGASLVLLTGANITTAVGDYAIWAPYAAGVVRMVAYSRASGNSLVVQAASNVRNFVGNGSFAINQRVTMPTTDNSYCVDQWRLLLGAANASTVTQDTADVPVGAGYAVKLTVGSGNNNKFGIFHPIENVNMLAARGNACSIRVPLKATAGLTNGTGKIRIGILQWTGTADAISATPISSWNVEGTNPTLIAGWAFANTPAAIAVTTSWADYLVENISINASATNLGVFVWCDETSTTTTTDILRVGGYVTMSIGTTAPSGLVKSFQDELEECQRYYCKTFPLATAPAQNAGRTGDFEQVAAGGGVNAGASWFYPVIMRTAPSVTTYNPSATNANWRDFTGAADRAVTVLDTSANRVSLSSATTANNATGIHISADASL